MKTFTYETACVVLSISLAALVHLQQIMVTSSPVPGYNPDQVSAGLELKRRFYPQEDSTIPLNKYVQEKLLLRTLFRLGIIQYINRNDLEFEKGNRIMLRDVMNGVSAPSIEEETGNAYITDKTVFSGNTQGYAGFKSPVEMADQIVRISLERNKNNKMAENNPTRMSQNVDKNESPEQVAPPMNKRMNISCDFSNMTLNMLLEYIRTGRFCGSRASPVRFGLGR